MPLLGRYLSHVLWKVAVLVFLYELTGACFSALHFEKVKKIYLSCIPHPPPPTPCRQFYANFRFGSRKYLILPNSAPTVRRHGSTGHNAQVITAVVLNITFFGDGSLFRWASSFRRFEASELSSSGSNSPRRITDLLLDPEDGDTNIIRKV